MRLLRVTLDLLAQPVDVGVDGAGLDLDLIPPDLAQELPPADHLAGLRGQQGEQIELGQGQSDLPALTPDLTAIHVDDQARELEARLGLLLGDGLLAATEMGADPGQQLADLEWFGEVVVRPNLKPHHDVDRVVLGGEHDHRHLGAVRAQLAADVHTAHAGQVQVEDDQIRFGLLQHLHPLLAGIGLEQVQVLTDACHPHDFARRRVVLDHQDRLRE